MLFIMRGLPGSGKSRQARNMVETADVLTLRVNMDDIRTSMFPGLPFSKSREDAVSSIRDVLIRHGLYYGLDVISDDTNLNPRTFARVEAIAESCGSPVTVKDLTDVPLRTCLANNTGPNRTAVPEHVIHRMWYSYLAPFAKDRKDAYTDDTWTVSVYKSKGSWVWDTTCLVDSSLDAASPLGFETHEEACVSAWLDYENRAAVLEREQELFVQDVLSDGL